MLGWVPLSSQVVEEFPESLSNTPEDSRRHTMRGYQAQILDVFSLILFCEKNNLSDF